MFYANFSQTKLFETFDELKIWRHQPLFIICRGSQQTWERGFENDCDSNFNNR